MNRLHDSNRLGSYLDREEFQIERVIVWVDIPPHGNRTGWLERADRVFDEIWRAIPDVVSAARLGPGAQVADPGKTHDEAGVSSERLAVRGIWIDPVNGSAQYEVGAECGYDGGDAIEPPGRPDGRSVMVHRDPGGELLVRDSSIHPSLKGRSGLFGRIGWFIIESYHPDEQTVGGLRSHGEWPMKSKNTEISGGDPELAQASASPPTPRDAEDLPDGAKSMSLLQWFLIAAVLAGSCLVGEFVLGCAWFFSPGWANDPLFGPNFHAVLATAITGWIAVMLMTAAAGAGALVGSGCALLEVGERRGRRVYSGWLLFATVVILFLSIWIFRSFYAKVWRDFPDGYHVASHAAGANEVTIRGSYGGPKS
jgi:hypothetical protein